MTGTSRGLSWHKRTDQSTDKQAEPKRANKPASKPSSAWWRRWWRQQSENFGEKAPPPQRLTNRLFRRSSVSACVMHARRPRMCCPVVQPGRTGQDKAGRRKRQYRARRDNAVRPQQAAASSFNPSVLHHNPSACVLQCSLHVVYTMRDQYRPQTGSGVCKPHSACAEAESRPMRVQYQPRRSHKHKQRKHRAGSASIPVVRSPLTPQWLGKWGSGIVIYTS